ncbi:retrovirus-related Pol polyprotein from transposon 17.6 [Trichonephila clavipes]|uniref:Retrovirus-related Pol polyprotein from transposon 17.6 n=1 Tax=Trichonephila clavipes TaxID=2585209 RepID=A0A8X6REQ6_TRICX|nr:retrovirus-related Pol polyprotein from transposon 17.6 [Trichonephila clavipes]
MLKEVTIIPIQSPNASPVVLCRKNNELPPDNPEAYRFAVDYRKLNAITKYPRYPLSLIYDLITYIPHTTIMSSLDLRWGYFQLVVNPSDIVKTAFVTQNGTYALQRMPFGLSGATPNFQKAINIILKLVIGRFEQRPVVYVSRMLSSAERNNTVTERECLAVVWALNKFRTYLGSLPAKVITDDAALTRLTNDEQRKIERGLWDTNGRSNLNLEDQRVSIERDRDSREAKRNRTAKRKLTSVNSNDLPYFRKRCRRDETVMPTTSRYKLRPRRGAKVESRPPSEKRVQQGGPVGSRGNRGQQSTAPALKSKEGQAAGVPEAEEVSNSIARRGQEDREQSKIPAP